MKDRSWLIGATALTWVSAGANAQAGAVPQSARTLAAIRELRDSQIYDLQQERARIDREIDALRAGPAAAAPAPVLPVVAAPPEQIAPAPDVAGPAAPAVTPAAPPGPDAPAKKDAAAVAAVSTTDTPKGVADGAPDGTKFGGLDLGAGLSFTIDVGRQDRISRASRVDGIVRVDDQDNGRARLMFESHYFFTPCSGSLFGLINPCLPGKSEGRVYRAADRSTARWGIGPFIAIQPGSNQVIDAIGMGVMVGARREMTGQSFNLGFGVVFDPNTRVLGDGIVANMPLPGGETDVRYRETLQTGVLILTSFSF